MFRSDGYSGRWEENVTAVALPGCESTVVGRFFAVAFPRTADQHGPTSCERFGDSGTVAGSAACSSSPGRGGGAMESWERRAGDVRFFENRTREYHFVP